jgi:hypothetical protein
MLTRLPRPSSPELCGMLMQFRVTKAKHMWYRIVPESWISRYNQSIDRGCP